ncbi:MAG: flagellar hook-basal body protein [Candidatus Cloacimonetes bacterium]|nr:flagellar hook-basal body protein [Candidatus Cloacimonadota bacterium]
MVRGIFYGSSAMQYLDEKMDIISNNLANANTNGFKRSGVAFNMHMVAEQAKHRDQNFIDPLPRGEIKSYLEYTQGHLQQTANPLDFALSGSGFFTIQTPDGFAFTRDGGFTMNDEGFLSTMDGYLVYGEYGPIRVNSNDFSISDKGDIVVNNQIVNKFQIYDFDITDLVQRGNNLLYVKNEFVEYREPNALIQQGFLEGSNVSIVKEMIEMIAINRQYQANDKAIKTNDDALQKAVRDIAR